jgi:hypothetical protein
MNTFQRLFGVSVPQEAAPVPRTKSFGDLAGGGAVVPTAPTPATTAAFLTPQSLTNFPVASAITAGLRKAIKDNSDYLQSNGSALVPALAIGLLIFLINQATRTDKDHPAFPIYIEIAVALLNCGVLWMAALGIDVVF